MNLEHTLFDVQVTFLSGVLEGVEIYLQAPEGLPNMEWSYRYLSGLPGSPRQRNFFEPGGWHGPHAHGFIIGDGSSPAVFQFRHTASKTLNRGGQSGTLRAPAALWRRRGV